MTEQKRYEQLYKDLIVNGELFYSGRLLERAARLWPAGIALICQGQKITWKELQDRALRVSEQLVKSGIKPDDRVMLMYENAINYYVAYYGIWAIGAVVVPVNTMLHANELGHIIKTAQPKGLIISDALFKDLHHLTKEISIVVTESDINALMNNPVPMTNLIVSKNPDDLAVLLYTSGTTGLPKGVMLSSRNIMINMIQGCARLQAGPHDRVLGAMPLFHSFTQNVCIWLAAYLGVTVILVPKVERRALLEGLSHDPTFIVGIPQLYGLFCLMKTAPFKNVKYFISGGDALATKIRMNFELIYRRKIVNGYGLTETSPFLAADLDDMIKPPDTVGRPLIHIDCEIRDDAGNVMPHGKAGVLWAKGPNIMLGYYNAPEATAEVIQDGWFNTGDIAFINGQNKIVLCGRQKDLIKVKGIKVYPGVIEQVLMSHPAVLGAAVVGKKFDEEEVPVAFVMAKHAPANLEAELLELCRNNLAAYEVPRRIIIRDELPMTATGKVDKKVLRNE